MKIVLVTLGITSAALSALFIQSFSSFAGLEYRHTLIGQNISSAVDAVLPSAPIAEASVVKTAPVIKAAENFAPSFLVIPSIGVNAKVKSLGLEADGKMAVPHNYTQVGLYSLGAKPGEKGTAVMGAHVDNGSSIAGVFKKLSSIKVGSIVYYTTPEGKRLAFKVVKTKVYAYNQKDTSEVFSSDKTKARLNLITCHGNWIPSQHTYDKRFVVFTEQVSA